MNIMYPLFTPNENIMPIDLMLLIGDFPVARIWSNVGMVGGVSIYKSTPCDATHPIIS